MLSPRGELRKLTSVNDALMAELRLPTVEYVHFKSKDGTSVAGYLYKPPDYQPGVKISHDFEASWRAGVGLLRGI